MACGAQGWFPGLNEYRELVDSCGRIFKAGMGAEAGMTGA